MQKSLPLQRIEPWSSYFRTFLARPDFGNFIIICQCHDSEDGINIPQLSFHGFPPLLGTVSEVTKTSTPHRPPARMYDFTLIVTNFCRSVIESTRPV
jgi:hypothetical protein